MWLGLVFGLGRVGVGVRVEDGWVLTGVLVG